MSEETFTDPREQARTEYAYGQDAFERGNYRVAVGHFEKAVGLARASTPLGGEIQTWLVNAYTAVGRPGDAIALCEKLTLHPDTEVRKQAKNLLYILKAPQLKRPGNWMSQIPDLGEMVEDNPQAISNATAGVTPKSPPSKRPAPEPEPIDPSQINSRDNGFLWAALIVIILVLGGLLYLSY